MSEKRIALGTRNQNVMLSIIVDGIETEVEMPSNYARSVAEKLVYMAGMADAERATAAGIRVGN